MKQNIHRTVLFVFCISLIACVSTVEDNQAKILSTVTAQPIITNQPHIYTDPDGLYSITLPSHWKQMNENTYLGEDGFFEAGYLSEDKMYMPNSMNVCQWIANIETKSTYFIHFLLIGNQLGGCTLNALPELGINTAQSIIKNPFGEFSKQFFNIKTDVKHHNEIMKSFVWLRDANQKSSSTPLPLSDDILSFWENKTANYDGITITEYKLPDEAQKEDPARKIFLQFIPSNVPQQEKIIFSPSSEETWEDVNEKIASFGYELKQDNTEYRQYLLYKDDELLLENIQTKSRIFSYETNEGLQIALALDVWKIGENGPTGDVNGYLLQNDSLTEWGSIYNDPPFAPVLYNNELLWVRAAHGNSYVQIQNSKREVIFDFATYYGSSLPVYLFRGWKDSWVLEVSDFVIQDGEILNEKFGFEQVFNWRIINEKPFYFFRKGPRVGISYDSKFLSTYYDEIIHGYCCALGLNNPTRGINDIRFFAKRDGIWFYVIVEIN